MEVFSDSANWLTHCWSSRCSREYIRAMEAAISKKFSGSTGKGGCQQKLSLSLSQRCNAEEYEPLKLQLVIQGIKRWPREKSVKKYWKGFVIVQSVWFFASVEVPGPVTATTYPLCHFLSSPAALHRPSGHKTERTEYLLQSSVLSSVLWTEYLCQWRKVKGASLENLH